MFAPAPGIDRQATVGTNARDDRELMEVWLKSHQDSSPHTLTLYRRIGERFLDALTANGVHMRVATVEDVQRAIDTLRVKPDGTPIKASSVNTYIASVKSLLGFAHKVGYTRFSAGPLIKLRKTGRVVAQRIMSELATRKLIDAGKPGRDRLLLDVGYFGGLRVTELVTLEWRQVIPQGQRRVQLEITGKGDKVRQVLLPAADCQAAAGQPGRCAAGGAGVPVDAPAWAGSQPAGRKLHHQARGQACRRQSGGLGALAAACPCLPCHRQRRAGHAGERNAGPCGFENDVDLLPRQAGRELGSVSENRVRKSGRVV